MNIKALKFIHVSWDLHSLILMLNNGEAVSQLEYSKVIGCLMYVMTNTRPDIIFDVGNIIRFTINPSTHHWKSVRMVLKYLKKTMDYNLTYVGFPSAQNDIQMLVRLSM